ncbi:MAG TPA: hypothetical protein VKX40_01780 [Aequorivita sp.]|nr:hypothetical protein [Aequorivita sp.]
MAPFNLENNIRESLESRELKPSPQAWEKLEAQLDKKQPKRKMVLWYYAAASFVGILILGSIFFSPINLDEDPKLVKENTEENFVEKQFEITPKSSSQDKVVLENSEEKTKAIKRSSNDQVKPIPIKKESSVDRKIRNSEALAEVPRNELKQSSEAETISKEENYLIEDKVDEVVASIKTIQKNNSEVSAEEVEILLLNARRNIQANRLLQTPTVDAVSLLEEVEWELDKSFRDKVFDALGDGFQKLRVAIAERND